MENFQARKYTAMKEHRAPNKFYVTLKASVNCLLAVIRFSILLPNTRKFLFYDHIWDRPEVAIKIIYDYPNVWCDRLFFFFF